MKMNNGDRRGALEPKQKIEERLQKSKYRTRQQQENQQ